MFMMRPVSRRSKTGGYPTVMAADLFAGDAHISVQVAQVTDEVEYLVYLDVSGDGSLLLGRRELEALADDLKALASLLPA